MTTPRRITTAVVVSLGFLMGATPALAYQANLTPNGSLVPAGSPSVTSQPTVSTPSTPTVVRVTAPSGFDWGDAGIGAAGGLALTMIGVGGALAASQRRDRHTQRNPALTS